MTDAAITALLNYSQADEDGIMVFASRQAIHEVLDRLAAAEERVKRLESALKPFADIGNGDPDRKHGSWFVKFEELEAARTALGDSK